MTRQVAWRKSSYTGEAENNCVEVAISEVSVGVRDSKAPAVGELAFPISIWHAFLGPWKR